MSIDQYSFTLCSQKLRIRTCCEVHISRLAVVITMQERVLTRNQEGWYQVSLLLQTAPHPRMDRIFHSQILAPIHPGQKFTLKADHDSYDLCIVETDDMIDARTAATNALFFACWWGDREMVQWLVRDLRKLIDIDTLIDDKNVIEWIVGEVVEQGLDHEGYAARYERYAAHLDRFTDICRYLIISFGSKIDANRPSGIILKACSYPYKNYCTDILVHMIKTYGAELIHPRDTCCIFEKLIKDDCDEEALVYLEQHKDLIAGNSRDIFTNILAPLAKKGSVHMFKLMLDRFGLRIDLPEIEDVFRELYHGDCEKIEVALSVWTNQVTPKVIEGFLLRCKKKAVRLIISSYMDLIQGQGISVALAACMPHDLELFDEVFRRNQEQVQNDHGLLKHAVLECCSSRDIEALEHILAKYGFLIYHMVLKFWAIIGDLDAVKMIFEAIPDISTVAKHLPMILLRACHKGDTEMVELIIKFAGDLISEVSYRQAFFYACYGDSDDIIRLFATTYSHYYDYRYDKIKPQLNRITLQTTRLLNEIYDTTHTARSHWRSMNTPHLRTFVEHNGVRVIMYDLFKSTKTVY